MAMTTPTAQSLINTARGLADAETPTPATDVVTDTELLGRLNAAYHELVDFIAGCSDGAIGLLATSASVASPYTLPADFYRLVAVDLPDPSRTNRWVAAKSFNFAERNREKSFAFPEYRLVGNALMFTPSDTPFTSTIRIWYVPQFTDLANLASTVTTFGGWDDYLTGSLAAYIAVKEGTEPGDHLALKKAAADRIALAIKDMVLTETQTIAEVEFQAEDFLDYLQRWT